MNIITQLEFQLDFTNSEKQIASYILENSHDVINMSIKKLATLTYTSPATIVRLCKKLNVDGFNAFKIKLSHELSLNTHTNTIDVNYPFYKNDDSSLIAHNLSLLVNNVINDTIKLIDFNNLDKIISLIDSYNIIDIYGNSNSLISALSFQHKMTRINKNVNVRLIEGEQLFMARSSNQDHLSIIISYSGETEDILRCARTIKNKNSTIIALTSIGDNHLSFLADYCLYIDSKEKIFNKIAPFASSSSIDFLLNLIYSCIFSKNYDYYKEIKLSFDIKEDARHPKLSPINDD